MFPRITVINDSIEFLDLARDILNDAGYAVTTYSGDDLTVAGLRATQPDLVLLDLRLKTPTREMSGWEFLLLMRGDAALDSVPIVVCTADATALHERETELRDVAHAFVIRKPFDVPEFEATIARALEYRAGVADA
ncbi:MAG: response regulator [Candidatus Limnocylindria bacterium]